jgi:hypothetical protein
MRCAITLPEVCDNTVPEVSYSTVPEVCDNTVPEVRYSTVPEVCDNTVLEVCDSTVPEVCDNTVPEVCDSTVPAAHYYIVVIEVRGFIYYPELGYLRNKDVSFSQLTIELR